MRPALTTQEIETLLRKYRTLEAILENDKVELQARLLEGALNAAQDTEEVYEVISGLVLGGRRITGLPLPPAGNTSDSTMRVAMCYRAALQKEYSEPIKEVVQEINRIGEALAKIDAALNCLPDSQAILIRRLYIDGKSKKEVAEELGRSEYGIASSRKEAMRKLRLVLRISPDSYNWLLSLLSARPSSH